MVQLSVTIQHVPWRKDRNIWTERVCDRLREEDPDLALTVVEDHERAGCWPTFRRALLAATGTHHVMLQDDVAICRDFLASTAAAIRARPADLLSLYTQSPMIEEARARGFAWLENPGESGPALVWPTALIPEFLEWQARHINPDFDSDTLRVSMWGLKTRRTTYATAPSLVQHLGSTSSSMNLDHPGRVSPFYIGSETSGLTIDWSRGLEAPPVDGKGINNHWWRYYHD